MEIRPIRTAADHKAALREIERLMAFPDDSPENDKLDVLATLVGAYEDRRWPIDNVSPSEILEFAITDMGRSEGDLSVLLGSSVLAEELLSGRRKVSLADAQTISAAWRVPIQLLVAPYPDKAA